MRLVNVKRIYGGHGGYIAAMAGLSGQTANLTDDTMDGLKATVRRLIDLDRSSQERFLSLFAMLKESELDAPDRRHVAQPAGEPVLGA